MDTCTVEPDETSQSNMQTESEEQGPFLLQSSCANCSIPLSVEDFVASFTVPGKMEQRSVYQMIELIFKGHEPPDDHPNVFKFCSSCGSIFEKILSLYMELLSVTSVGSYIFNIRQGVKKEAVDRILEEAHVDLSLFEGLSISLNEAPILKHETMTSLEDSATIRSKRTSPRTRKPTVRYRNIELPRKKRKVSVYAIVQSSKKRSSRVNKSMDREDSEETNCSLARVEETDPLELSSTENNEENEECTENNYENEDEQSTPPSSPRPRRGRRKIASAYKSNGRGICRVCKTRIPEDVSMSEHLETHFEFPWKCGDCGKKFRVRSSYNSHVNAKNHRTNYVSQRRGLDLASRKNISEHSETLSRLLEIQDYKCDSLECTKDLISFSTFKEWVLHQENLHEVKTGFDLATITDTEDLKIKSGCLRPCSQCGKKFKNNETMLVHLKSVHLKLRPYSCNICGRTSSTKANANTHRRTHDEPNNSGNPNHNFLCTLCGSTFKVKTSLDIHEKTHLNLLVMKYSCELCNLKFPSPSRLRIHKATAHCEERPFKCPFCDLTFKLKASLDRHRVRQHEKKFNRDEICEMCEKAFRNKTHLKEHLMAVHKLPKEQARISAKIKPAAVFRILPDGTHQYPQKPLKPKTCEFCNRTYVRREQLFTHMISIHGKTEEEAKEITGLESKRNLLPGGGNSSSSRKRRDEHSLEFYQL